MTDPTSTPAADSRRRRLLITAGPTHEPIDAVRFIGNRSSGRLGVALADEAARRSWSVTLLLGPTHLTPPDSNVRLRRFRTTEDLRTLLREEARDADVLVMAAAVADYRPKSDQTSLEGKRRRRGEGMTLELEATPDLLAECAGLRREGQLLVGFALEPAAELMDSARRKLERKRIDLIVANPLETMDGARIEATILGRPGSGLEEGVRTEGAVPKEAFAGWLLDVVESRLG